MKINKIVPLLLLSILMLTGISSAWEDTVERYPTGSYTDYWASSSDVTKTTYPSGSSYHCLYFYSYSGYTSSSSGVSHTATTSTNDYYYDDYMSMRVKQYTTTNNWGGQSYLRLKLISSEGITIANTLLFSQTSSYAESECLFEIVTTGGDIYLYKNGVFVSDIGDATSNSCKIQLDLYSYAELYAKTYAYLWIDDISCDGSCIGTPEVWNELSETIDYSSTIQAYDSYPTAIYTTSLYSITNTDNAGLVTSQNITTRSTDMSINRTLIGSNYGLYLLETTRDDTVLTSKYFYYDNLAAPTGYPETLFSASSDVAMEIRDADNNGGTISSDGSVYLYPDNDSGIYPIRYTLSGAPYSFTANLNAVYGNELINSTPFTFSGLSNTYVATLDGESLSGTKASGTLVISQNATDGETVTIGDDVYEFESSGGVTSGNIQVDIGDNQSVTGANLAEKINSDGVTGVSASVIAGSGDDNETAYYYSDITITNNIEIDDYQAKVTIAYDDEMSEDFSNIRFFDGETSIPYWVESKTNSTSAVVWIPISDGSDIQCRWKISGETVSESNIDSVMLFGDEFDGSSLNTVKWNYGGSPAVTSSQVQINGAGEYIISKTSFGTNTTLECKGILANVNYHYLGYMPNAEGSPLISLQFGYPTASTYNARAYTTSGVSTNIGSGYTGVHNWKICRTGSSSAVYYVDNSLVSTHSTQIPSNSMPIILAQAPSASEGTSTFDSVFVRQYAATEPTLSVGSIQTCTTSDAASIIVVSDEYGTTSNDIATTETCAGSEWGAETLLGGSGGSVVDTAIWEYEVTDWTSITNHIFSFSPDLTIPGVYGYVKDVSTQEGIAAVTVTITGTNTSYVYTDENGFYYLTNGMELNKPYTVSAAKSGYEQGVTFSVTTTAGATSRKDLYLTAEESTSGVYYAVHYVKLVVVDKSWHKLNATMTVSSANETLCTDMVLGTDGALSLQMTEDTKYKIQTTYNGLTQTDYITPSDDVYYIIWDATDATLVTEQFYEYINVDISKEITSPSEANINITYTDGKADTNSVSFILGQYAENGTFITLQTSSTFTANCSTGFTVTDYTGETYVIKANINHGTFGTITKYYSVSFTGSNLPFTGKALAYFAIFILFIVAFQFGKAEHASGAIMLCGVCWLFWYVGIFETFGTTINTTMFAGLSLATIYSLATYINEKRREEGV
ncbi:MAG: DUF2341 domain-containing protein [Clostridia bacterium]|jgi:hypothetical protein|nr:DUF2341 domain-containing protein [Clostridia bacterium]